MQKRNGLGTVGFLLLLKRYNNHSKSQKAFLAALVVLLPLASENREIQTHGRGAQRKKARAAQKNVVSLYVLIQYSSLQEREKCVVFRWQERKRERERERERRDTAFSLTQHNTGS